VDVESAALGLCELIRNPVSGGTILLITQYLEEADQLADEVAVLDGGRIVKSL
jgi:ABC-2 type transport system ATP-binding protein